MLNLTHFLICFKGLDIFIALLCNIKLLLLGFLFHERKDFNDTIYQLSLM